MASVCPSLAGVEGARVQQGATRNASELRFPFPSAMQSTATSVGSSFLPLLDSIPVF